MMKVLYNGIYGGGHPFVTLAKSVKSVKRPEEMDSDSSALVVWGGADIEPSIYGHPKSETCYTHPERDGQEMALIRQAIDMSIPIIGVCRGAQLLCAMAGGFLIQDTSNHAGRYHECLTSEGSVIKVNSIHHQMMAGYEELDHELLAWSKDRLSTHYTWKDDRAYPIPDTFVEPELINFNSIKGFAIQWHPEAMASETDATQFILGEFRARYC